MALNLTGIEITLDLAIIGSIALAAATWLVAKQKTRNDELKEQRRRDYSVSLRQLNKIIPPTQKLINFINRGGQIKDGDEKLVPEVQALVSDSTVSVFGCSDEIMSAVVACNNDFNYVQMHDQTDRGIKFMVYSVVNMTYRFFERLYGEKQAKNAVRSIFPVGDDASVVLDKYTEMRKDFGVKD